MGLFCLMLEILIQADREFTLAINGMHAAFLDQIMIFISEKWAWIPLYAFLIYLIFKSFKIQEFIFLLLGIAMVIALADQTSSAFFKPLVQRLRPCHEPGLIPYLHLPAGCGGQFGFVSSHAANCFGLAFFLSSILGKKYMNLNLMFLWAFLISWSRIYLGAHYLGDVLVAGFVGIFWAWLVLFFLRRFGLIPQSLPEI